MPPYQYFKIHPAFQDIISFIGIMDFDFKAAGVSSAYHFPWLQNAHLFFTISGDPLLLKSNGSGIFSPQPSSYFVAPKLMNITADFGERRQVAAIIFKPGGFHRLTGIPVNELLNYDLDASFLFGKEIRETEMKLKETRGDRQEIMRIIEEFLFAKTKSLRPSLPFDLALNYLISNSSDITIKQLASLSCLSYRQTERKAFEKLGMGAKLFAQLARFSKAYAIKEVSPDCSWTKIANECGYYDQSHLIRDFKTFSGEKPNSLNSKINSSVKVMAALDGKFEIAGSNR